MHTISLSQGTQGHTPVGAFGKKLCMLQFTTANALPAFDAMQKGEKGRNGKLSNLLVQLEKSDEHKIRKREGLGGIGEERLGEECKGKNQKGAARLKSYSCWCN